MSLYDEACDIMEKDGFISMKDLATLFNKPINNVEFIINRFETKGVLVYEDNEQIASKTPGRAYKNLRVLRLFDKDKL